MMCSLIESSDDDWPVVSVYTRADALADGVLVDVSSLAREAGFRYPTAITQALASVLEPTDDEKTFGQSFTGRLWDVFWRARLAASRSSQDRMVFNVFLAAANPDAPEGLSHQETTLIAVCGPGDLGEPVITIGYPSDF